MNGTLFDIREFCVHDGPGIRTTVFLKGCPLRCTWCHNPESQSFKPERMVGQAGERTAGREYSADELASILNRQAMILKSGQGGVTFSGGEPLYQASFVSEVIDRLDDLHVVLDTSGYGPSNNLEQLLSKVDLVYFDVKIMEPALHRKFVGQDNRTILENLRLVDKSGVPYVIRVPLIPGVTDTHNNLAAIADLAASLTGDVQVDLLPYNRAAGAKYAALGRQYEPGFDEDASVNADISYFEKNGIKVSVR